MFHPIKLDKARNFRFGMKAIHLIEKGLKIKSINELDLDNLSMEDTATVMWAGLVHEDKELTPDKVMELVDEHSSLVAALNEMGKAFTASFSGDEEPKK